MKSVPALLSFKPMKEEPTVSEKWVIATKPPYLVGEKCYVREVWCFFYSLYRGVNFIAYKSDLTAYQQSARWGDEKMDVTILENDPYMQPIQWRSPVTMPAWAARRFVTILSCEPVRVDEVTEEDAIKMGFQFDERNQVMARENFENDWRKRHPGKEWAWRVESQPTGITG